MPQGEINIPAIIVINLMGLAVLFAIGVGSDWRTVRRTTTVKALLLMAVSVAGACILEPLAYLLDGCNLVLSYIVNTLLYFTHCILPIGWVMMIASHLSVKLSSVHKWILRVYLIVSALVMLANFFVPIVFVVDVKGEYSRCVGYFVVLAIGLLICFDGVLISFRTRSRSDRIKFFPVWAFLVPALLGRAIQTAWYGLSTAVPFLAVSIGCCALCLQNERLYRDSHTHLYNRTYLNTLQDRLSKHATHAYTAIFLDVNCFKAINDTYGHVEGDKALIRLAEVLKDLVADKGEVIRYAGDEFFILYNSPEQAEAECLVYAIDDALASLPIDEEKPYRLSVSTGYCSLDFRYESMDEVLDKVDQLMYEQKRQYYSNNTLFDRRGSK